MSSGRQMMRTGLSVGAGAVLGALLAMSLSGRPANAGVAQDLAVQTQIQQALSNFKIQLQTELNMMQSEIDTLERQQQSMLLELSETERRRITEATPIPSDPIPGVRTYGRLVSESSEAYRFELHAPSGALLGQLATTSDGPGLVLLDASGQISVALVATPTGPELRMVDADGNLQTVLSGQ